MNTFWTEERRDEAMRLARDGFSALAIAKRLGCTKNAVIGMFNRDGISLTNLPPLPKPAPVMTGCRWVIGEVGVDWRYCGSATTEPGGSWCRKHRAIVYQGRAKLEDA